MWSALRSKTFSLKSVVHCVVSHRCYTGNWDGGGNHCTVVGGCHGRLGREAEGTTSKVKGLVGRKWEVKIWRNGGSRKLLEGVIPGLTFFIKIVKIRDRHRWIRLGETFLSVPISYFSDFYEESYGQFKISKNSNTKIPCKVAKSV